jgi:ribonuclease P/MRP protein subunit RPP40
MLCPEVWNFKAPESSFSFQKVRPNESNHLNIIQNFTYNHLVSLVLPDTFKVPESLTQVLSNDCDYYKLINVKLNEFVTKNFFTNFVNSGSLYILSVDSRIDCDNCVAVTPNGRLILNLNKSTYQSLGLEGSVSHFHAKSRDRYVVTIDLKQKHFKPGKPNYERTKTCLEKLTQNVIVTWEPKNEEICPSSIAKYFHDLGYRTELCKTRFKSHTLYSVKVPNIDDDNVHDVVEWLGMVALHGNVTDGGPDNYSSTYETPEPNREGGQVKFLQWRGLFTTNQITRLHDKLRDFKENKGCEWGAMYVQGFSDSPVAWNGQEHHYYTNGDNGYVLILTNDHLITFVQNCSRKRYINKRKGKAL